MRLIQFETEDGRAVGAITDGRAQRLRGVDSTLALARAAIAESTSLAEAAAARLGEAVDYDKLLAAGAVLPPADHPEPARALVSGTGLTHTGSAAARDKMHTQDNKTEAKAKPETDSMRMFRLGLDGGKPAPGVFLGAQPEWFYKGDGACIVRPGGALARPAFADDGGEEPEVVGVYWIDDNGDPRRLGFALGNEFSDHVMEKQNYLWLAHSKLRVCAFGPELLLGALPSDIRGECAIRRGESAIWQKPFASGEDNMSHSIANLERHHFKYPAHRRPGDLHIHFFGTATLSFADGIEAQDGDEFIVQCAAFGRPLINRLRVEQDLAHAEVIPL